MVPPEGTETPAAQPPVFGPAEIQALVAAEAQRIVDSRIPGLQSAYEKQIASLKKELKRAQSDTGYAGSDSSELEAELVKVRREADALRAGRQYPDAFPVYESLMQADSVEEQLDILQAFVRGVPAPATPPAQVAQPQPPVAQPSPPVDLNRPLEPSVPAGDQMTRELAESLFDRIGNVWPKWG
jgi:hypothetical protein